MIADCITLSRILFSFLLFVFSPSSYGFAILYLLCGVTDVLDGFAARKLHTASEKGARLDSAADLVFAVTYAVRILPLLTLPLWIWVLTAGIAVTKGTFILLQSVKSRTLSVRHSLLNRLTGLAVFLLPLTVRFAAAKYGAVCVCVLAALSTAEEIAAAVRCRK